MHPKPPASELVTKPEAARELRVCVRSVENFLKARRLSYVKMGRSVRIERSEIQRFKESLTVKSIG
jgi:excisionase family DNA binding protein